MSGPWNKENVHFIFERRMTLDRYVTGIFVDEPLLSVSIPAPGLSTKATSHSNETDVDDDDEDYDFFNYDTRKIPKIMGLGVMLIEIQLGRPIESLYKADNYSAHFGPNGEVYSHTNYEICKELITKSNMFEKMETSDTLKDLITNCIFPNEVFMPPHVKNLEDDEIRQALYPLALDWCMNNNIDIVCMACGFFTHDNDLEDKIQEASRKMLILAAPTNSGNRQDITYPSRHDAFVVPMFATDGNVKKSGLNPSQGPGKYNFAILGEDIKDFRGEVKSGTSYATAIATGLLARLLDFSRHNEMVEMREKAQKMKDMKNAMAVLYSMTRGTKDDPFYCIRPWDLLPTDLRSQIPFPLSRLPDKKDIEEARRSVSWKILSAMDDGLV
ncbi:hypothetical protein QIS74_12044 [Colletotrichum tabaci]|uniref:Peptidase S8/S53 domain-containing protein n=1 Tax=Colletotrichum tabaci TaxID=1209068 RepID=A0AAV9SXZ0_9PEZI